MTKNAGGGVVRDGIRWILGIAAVAVFAAPAAAQIDTTRVPSGVRLGLIYQTAYRPTLVVRPLEIDSSAADLAAASDEVASILRRDLEYSHRFEMDAAPPELAAGPVRYEAWDERGVVYLVTGALVPDGDGYRLRVALHDVVYGDVSDVRAFDLPAEDAPGFRMAVHRASDAIVRWATGDPGMAASRILFIRRNENGSRDLLVVDSDGEDVRRLMTSEAVVLSPTWSPDGQRLAYAHGSKEGWSIRERDLRTGRERMLAARPGLNYTPAYSADGRRIAFASTAGSGTVIFEMDVREGCCDGQISRGARDDLSPTYSPDGRRIAFNSNRLGQPHVYVKRLDGGEPELLSPFVYGEPGYYTSPDWSPANSLVAFHGRSRGGFQIMVADADEPGGAVRQVTREGISEDPSWAPDGRHVVFSGVRDRGPGLYVLDTVSGELRPLVLGAKFVVPDWSPTLASAPDRSGDGR